MSGPRTFPGTAQPKPERAASNCVSVAAGQERGVPVTRGLRLSTQGAPPPALPFICFYKTSRYGVALRNRPSSHSCVPRPQTERRGPRSPVASGLLVTLWSTAHRRACPHGGRDYRRAPTLSKCLYLVRVPQAPSAPFFFFLNERNRRLRSTHRVPVTALRFGDTRTRETWPAWVSPSEEGQTGEQTVLGRPQRV